MPKWPLKPWRRRTYDRFLHMHERGGKVYGRPDGLWSAVKRTIKARRLFRLSKSKATTP